MPRNKVLIALYTLLRKEVVRFMRMWPQTLLPPVVTVFLYIVIFGGFIGKQIGTVQGLPYISFLVPGLVMMAVINSAFGNVVSSFYIAKFTREIEELLVSPMPLWVMITGFVAAGVIRGFVVAMLVLGISLLFWPPSFFNWPIILCFLTLTGLVFSLAGLINGIFARKFDDIMLFSTFILVPLTYLGGVFYTIDALPSQWRVISAFNPILYMIDGFRYGFYGHSDLNMWEGLAILLFCSAVLSVFAYTLLKKGVGIKR